MANSKEIHNEDAHNKGNYNNDKKEKKEEKNYLSNLFF